jgi:hypothetical protein
MAVVLPPINEVIDMHSIHLAMARRHMPVPIMAVLLGDDGSRRWPAGLRQWSHGPPVFSARFRLRSRSCSRSVDGHRPGLSGHRHY